MNWSSWSQPLEWYYRNSYIIRIQDGCRPPVNFPRGFRYSGETNGLIWNLTNLLGQESNVLSLNGYKLETPSENVLFPIHHKSGLFLPIHLHRPHIKLKRITVKTFVQENLEFLFRIFQRCNCWFEKGWEDFKWMSLWVTTQSLITTLSTKIRVEQVEFICSWHWPNRTELNS